MASERVNHVLQEALTELLAEQTRIDNAVSEVQNLLGGGAEAAPRHERTAKRRRASARKRTGQRLESGDDLVPAATETNVWQSIIP